jgi:hypothetical protein
MAPKQFSGRSRFRGPVQLIGEGKVIGIFRVPVPGVFRRTWVKFQAWLTIRCKSLEMATVSSRFRSGILYDAEMISFSMIEFSLTNGQIIASFAGST